MTTATQIINGAAEEIGVKTAEIALQPGDFQVILDRMNDMLSEWADLGRAPSFVDVSDGADTVSIDRNAVAAAKYNLAIRIAPSFGRVVTPTLTALAGGTLNNLRTSVNHIGKVAFPDTLPTGSGNDCPDSFNEDRFFPSNQPENF